MSARKAKRKIYQLLEGRVRPRWQIVMVRPGRRARTWFWEGARL